jgi:hypothetical protein
VKKYRLGQHGTRRERSDRRDERDVDMHAQPAGSLRSTVRWWIVMLSVLVIAVAGTVYFDHQAQAIRSTAKTACLNSSESRISQLRIDWVIYTADHAIGLTRPATMATRTRASEAAEILAGIQAIAGVRIDKRYASLLPAPLAATVRNTDFSCH